MRSLNPLWKGLSAAVLLAVAIPAPAAEVDKYLPSDTEFVLTVNVKSFLDSAIVKKQVLDRLRGLLKDNEEVQKVFTSLGLDPFKDLDRVTVAAPASGDNDRGLFILHGRFDAAKFRAKAEEAAKEHGDRFKILKVSDGASGKYTLYQFTLPEQQQPLFAALIDKGPLVLSPGKDYVISALNKGAGRELAELKSKAMQSLLEKADPKQAVMIVALGPAVAKILPDDASTVRDLFNKVEAVTGGITVADTIKLEVAFTARDAATAKDVKQAITDNVNQTLAVLALAADSQKQLAPLVDVLKKIQTSASDRVVTLKAELGADVLEKLIPKDK
jgi:hypothetical protein